MKGLLFFLCMLGIFTLIFFEAACKEKAIESPPSSGNAPANSPYPETEKVHNNTYRMIIKSNPDVIATGKQVVFTLTPQNVEKPTEPVPLDINHGYEIHFIIVSNDLSFFDHRHPGLSDLGSYEQAYAFKSGGTFILYADYKPTNSKDTFQMEYIGVNGSSPKAVSYTSPRYITVAGPFEASLSTEQGSHFESGTMQMIHASITKDGITVNPNSLGDYLGSKGHMVIIGVKDKDYLHVHPEIGNGDLIFHTEFSKAGFYRAWLQFQTENIIQTADFVIQVDSPSQIPGSDEKEPHHSDQH